MKLTKARKEPEILIQHGTAVLHSDYKLADWKTALNYDPDLGLYDDNDHQIFRARIETGSGSMTENEIVFSNVPDEDGYAQASLPLDSTDETSVDTVADQYCLGLLRLIEVEENLETVIREAKEHRENLLRHIRIIE